MNWMSSSPLMSGMLMSVMTRSYGPRGKSRSASKPPAASTTATSPSSALPDSSAVRTNERMLDESSTTRIFGTLLLVSLLLVVGGAGYDGALHRSRAVNAREPIGEVDEELRALLAEPERSVAATFVRF